MKFSLSPNPKAKVEMENSCNQEKARCEKNESKDTTRFIKIYRDKYLLATRPPVLLMFLRLLSRQVVSWSSRSEDNSPLSIPHTGASPLQFITR